MMFEDRQHQNKAVQIVADYLEDHLEKTDPVPDYQIYIVWFCYTLGNWKALLSTTLPDGTYYEVTHKKENDGSDGPAETYLDVYKKFDNVCIPDTPPPTLESVDPASWA